MLQTFSPVAGLLLPVHPHGVCLCRARYVHTEKPKNSAAELAATAARRDRDVRVAERRLSEARVRKAAWSTSITVQPAAFITACASALPSAQGSVLSRISEQCSDIRDLVR